MGHLHEATRELNSLSRAELVERLRAIAAELPRPLDSRDLESRMWWAVRRHFGSMDAARRAAGLPDPPGNTIWTRDLVIEEIRRLARARVEITERSLEARGRRDLIGAIARHIGSIVRARRLARVPDPTPRGGKRQRWDEDRVIAEIRERHREGQPLAKSKTPTPLVKAGMRYHGSWQGAIEAAGLDYDRVRLVRAPYTKKELLDLLRGLRKAKPNLTYSELGAFAWRQTLIEQFGSVDAALQRAGLRGWPRRLRERAMDAETVAGALRARKRAGKPMYWRAVQEDDYHLWYSAMLQHGEWDRAIAAAHLPNARLTKVWSRDAIIAALRDRLARGESLKPSDMREEAAEVFYSVRNYFKTYVAAVRAAGGEASWKLTKWTPARIIAALRRKAGRQGRITAKIAGPKLAATCQHHFGSFSAACHAAGLLTGLE